MRGRETASGRMEKSAVLAPVPKQKVSIVEREGPGWTVWLDSKGDGDCPICGTGPNSRHGSYVRPLRDLPAQVTSVLIQATRRVAGSPRAPRFTCHRMGCGAIGMLRRASARVPHRVKQGRVRCSATAGPNGIQPSSALQAYGLAPPACRVEQRTCGRRGVAINAR
jgi:transposase